MRRFGLRVSVVATFPGFGAEQAQATNPQPSLMTSVAIRAFADAVNLACIYLKGVAIPLYALPSGVEDDLVPADPEDRMKTMAPKDRPVLISETMGNLLQVFDDKDGTCWVVAV